MAAVEMEKLLLSEKKPIISCPSDMSPDFDRQVDSAREALLMRDFERCHKLCLKGITHAKQYPESSRAQDGTEQFCVLCIQALAEMNQWQEVLPLVQKIYSGVEACPHTVIKLCMLLYAKVEEFSECHAVTSVWLRCKDNSSRTGYAEVASLYIEHVMLPQGRIVLVQQFLDSCTVLDTDVKQNLIEKFSSVTTIENKAAQSLAESSSGTATEHSSVDEVPREESEETDILAVVLSHIKAAASHIASKLSHPSVRILMKIAAVAVGVYLLFEISVKGDFVTSYGRAAVMWQAILKTWKSIFTPYRKGR